MHGSRVAHGVRADALGCEGRLLCGRSRDVPFEDRDYTEAGYPLVVRDQEKGISTVAQFPNQANRLRPQRSILPPRVEQSVPECFVHLYLLGLG